MLAGKVGRGKPSKIELLDFEPAFLRVEDSGARSHEALDVAKRLLLERRMRDELVGAELSSDPAWAMLLTLYGSDVVAVSDLAREVACPYATSLRYLILLRKGGWLRLSTPDSGQWSAVAELTEQGRRRLDVYLVSLLPSSQRAP